MELFLTFVRKQKDAYSFSDCTIGNMDEAPMSFDASANRAVDSYSFQDSEYCYSRAWKDFFYSCSGMHGQCGESSSHGDIQEKNYAKGKDYPQSGCLNEQKRLDEWARNGQIDWRLKAWGNFCGKS